MAEFIFPLKAEGNRLEQAFYDNINRTIENKITDSKIDGLEYEKKEGSLNGYRTLLIKSNNRRLVKNLLPRTLSDSTNIFSWSGVDLPLDVQETNYGAPLGNYEGIKQPPTSVEDSITVNFSDFLKRYGRILIKAREGHDIFWPASGKVKLYAREKKYEASVSVNGRFISAKRALTHLGNPDSVKITRLSVEDSRYKIEPI